MSKDLQEGIKTLLRTAVLAVIPLVIAQLQNGTIDWKTIGVAGAIALLVGIDKWLHEAEKGPWKNDGLAPF